MYVNSTTENASWGFSAVSTALYQLAMSRKETHLYYKNLCQMDIADFIVNYSYWFIRSNLLVLFLFLYFFVRAIEVDGSSQHFGGFLPPYFFKRKQGTTATEKL